MIWGLLNLLRRFVFHFSVRRQQKAPNSFTYGSGSARALPLPEYRKNNDSTDCWTWLKRNVVRKNIIYFSFTILSNRLFLQRSHGMLQSMFIRKLCNRLKNGLKLTLLFAIQWIYSKIKLQGLISNCGII